ncbi:serine/threonine protein kinase, partial [candidate division KSB1 bacterium]|nr:serine/threonine protein kinase [candidate division KSB1 bacterium]
MIGDNILHYCILEKIGEGGMGEVYLAEDIALARKVALKFLPQHYISDADLNKRFRREAKAAAALNHPNIVTIHEIGEHEGRAFIAMEYVEGESLRDIVKATGRSPLPIDQILNIVIQICEGLSAAHQTGIIHRDVKPENIIIDKTGRVRILDFGLAGMAGVSKLTKAGSTLGTVSYMSPEQFRSEPVDQRTDLWSLGVVLYEMLTGQLPFQGEYEQAVMYQVLNEEPQPVAKLRDDVPEILQQIVTKALSKRANARCQNADELLADLRELQQGKASGISAK